MNRAGLLRSLAPLAAGAVFSAGLGVSGMTRPSKVIGFLDLFGGWDASLALVMASAVCVGLLAFRLILRRPAPLLAPRFVLPPARGVDLELFSGAGLFGVGWGLSGLCPGPALVAVVTGAPGFLIFVATMAAGAFAANRLEHWRRAPAASERAQTTCG